MYSSKYIPSSFENVTKSARATDCKTHFIDPLRDLQGIYTSWGKEKYNVLMCSNDENYDSMPQ